MRTNIGFDVAAPTEECKDRNCPFHGTLSVRGQVIDGTVVSDKTARTVVVQREYLKIHSEVRTVRKEEVETTRS